MGLADALGAEDRVEVKYSDFYRLVRSEAENEFWSNAVHTGASREQILKILTGQNDELEEYRKTGLTPDQIREMDRLYSEKCKELATIRAEKEALEKQIGDPDKEPAADTDKRDPVEERICIEVPSFTCFSVIDSAFCRRETYERIYAMTVQEYQKKARRTQSKKLSQKERMLHAALGLNSEAGEVAGILQKKYQGHPVDRDHLIKELGDCLWMIAEACDAIGVPMEQVMAVNIKKLEERFPDGFTAERSLHRKEGDI